MNLKIFLAFANVAMAVILMVASLESNNGIASIVYFLSAMVPVTAAIWIANRI